MKKEKSLGAEPNYQVGESVRFQFGMERVTGVIVEDRGPLGVGGRRLYGIQFQLSHSEPWYIELPEAEMERVPEGELESQT
jgi:hypothetical protein